MFSNIENAESDIKPSEKDNMSSNTENAEGDIKPSEGDNLYKVLYDSKKIECRLCKVYVRRDSMDKHKDSKKHKDKAKNKYVVKNNGKEYYYDKKEEHSMKERMKNPEFKEKHYAILKKKVPCKKCGSVVVYSAMWRHKQSKKCQNFKVEK